MIMENPMRAIEFSNISALPEFYKKLGWDPEDMILNPKKIKVNPQDADKMLKDYLNTEDTSQEEILAIWLNFGPSQDSKVPQGKISLKRGWLAPRVQNTP